MAEHCPWVRSDSLNQDPEPLMPYIPAVKSRGLGRLAPLAVFTLMIASVAAFGSTGALYTSLAPAQTSSFLAGSHPVESIAPPPPFVVATCQPVPNLAYDPYLGRSTENGTQPALGGGSGANFNSLISSAKGILPPGVALPSGTIGIDGSASGVTGSSVQPVSGNTFAAGYCAGAELSQYSPSVAPGCPSPSLGPSAFTSVAQYDLCAIDPNAQVAVPSGTVNEPTLTGYSSTGPGVPFVAIYPLSAVTQAAGGGVTFTGTPIIPLVPVTVFYQNYSTVPGAYGSVSTGPRNQRVVITFSVASDVAPAAVSSARLLASSTYVAYLLIQASAQYGPLADHMWYFKP